VLLQMAAEATGLPMEKIEVLYSDTATSDNSGSASASRLTFMAGNSIIGAAEAAMEKWQTKNAPRLALINMSRRGRRLLIGNRPLFPEYHLWVCCRRD
jgi:CO/xanthine dehydrogenase Mo-binding subunit